MRFNTKVNRGATSKEILGLLLNFISQSDLRGFNRTLTSVSKTQETTLHARIAHRGSDLHATPQGQAIMLEGKCVGIQSETLFNFNPED